MASCVVQITNAVFGASIMASWSSRRVCGRPVTEWVIELLVGVAAIIVAFYILSRPARFPRAYYDGKDQFQWIKLLLDQNDRSSDEEAVTALCHMLLDEKAEHRIIRSTILGGLGSAGPRAKAAIPTLEIMLDKQQDQTLRDTVRDALHRIAPDEFPPPAPQLSRNSPPAKDEARK